MTAFYSWLARISYQRRWLIIGVWMVLLILGGIGASQAEHALKVGGFSLPGTEFNEASNVLARDLDISSDKAALVIFHSDTLFATDPEFHAAVEQAMANLNEEPIVTKTETFYDTGLPQMVSADNHTTYAWVTLEGDENLLEEESPHLRELVRSETVDAYLIGQAAVNFDVEQASAEDLVRVERFTFPIVFLLLVLVFGSLVAAGVPLVLGMVSVVSALAMLYVLAQVGDISIFALNTATMIGLGLAIDFSLILVSRFREELATRPVDEALEVMLQTAGRSITFSGVTLMMTMAVLTLFPVMIIRSIALSITVVAAIAVIAALTLLPAVIAVLGAWIERGDIRRALRLKRSGRTQFWERWSRRVMARPWVSLITVLLILGTMALPALWLERTGVTVDVLPQSSESREAFELVEEQFGPGYAAPIFVVIETADEGALWQPEIMTGVYELHQEIAADPRVVEVQSLASLIPNPSAEWMRSLSPVTIGANPDRERIATRIANLEGANTTTTLIVYPREGETDSATVDLMLDLREQTHAWAEEIPRTRALVGGAAAQHYDFDRVVYDQFPILLALSLLVTYVILMLFFHSLILPLKAIILNLIGLVATYGILVVVFQFGVGDFLLGFNSLGAVWSYTPVLLFSIMFGLSTDYEVFVLSRVREYYRQGHSNEEAVARGIDRTGGVITAAGLIMIVVFGSFALTEVLVIKEIGFALAVAVLLDMTLVRLVLVPASMKLMEDWNWWMPRSLGRFIPEIEESGPAPTAPAPSPAPSTPASD
ncbi:MMPL family transporter [soil metagenome]